MSIFENNSLSIGETPLIRLNRIKGVHPNNILVKVEGRNPAYSVKCRVASGIIQRALETGELKDGMTILEATSGNTGIGLAYAGAALGFKVAVTMPDNMSRERRLLMQAFGAELVLTPAELGMTGAIDMTDRMLQAEPDKYFWANQFSNPANPLVHERTTGPEIFRDTDGQVDVFVAGIGTGGTITGVSRYLKLDKKLDTVILGAEPKKSPVINQFMTGRALKGELHGIQGIGAGFIPDILDISLIDKVFEIEDSDAVSFARRLAREEGILSGISSGAALCTALKAVELYGLKDKNIVVILPDSGERYLSAGLF